MIHSFVFILRSWSANGKKIIIVMMLMICRTFFSLDLILSPTTCKDYLLLKGSGF